jgi:diguanylate cyclase (GGDEF)-like protein
VQSRAESIRQAIGSQKMIFNGMEISMTVSVGATVYTPRQSETAPMELVRCADEALYEAKNAGRNRVTFRSSSLVGPG